MKRFLALLCLILLAAACSAALGELAVSFSPENPRMGDYVDVTVVPGRENPQDVTYSLLCGGESVFAGKPVQHYAVSFRPRKEGVYTLRVAVRYGKDDIETVEVSVPVSGTAPAREGPEVVYSQKDGWWYKKKYSSRRDLQKAGCAIFALSHALQRMGIADESVVPDKLAKTYSYYYVEGRGTYNEGLVTKAAADYDFLTQKALLQSGKEIADSLARGDFLSFSIVDGHIALADGISEDGTKVHIVDSAAGAVFERIRTPGAVFVRNEDGSFTAVNAPEELPGLRWFFETQEYGGMTYWMDIGYCAKRGMRVLRRQWLKADPGDGLRGVTVEYAGALISKVKRDKESWRLPTRDLQITGVEPGAVEVAMVTAKNGTFLKDGNGKQISGKKRIPRNTMVLLLDSRGDLLWAWWDNAFGYLSAKDVTVLPAAGGDFLTGVIAQNGNTSGGSQVTVHLNPAAKSTGLAMWKTGTPVAVVEKQDHFFLLEAKGMRGWVHEKYVMLDQQEETEGSQEYGQKIDEGK